jgi:hypothetical protein
LNYVDRELSAWYRERREAQAQAVTALAAAVVSGAAQGRREGKAVKHALAQALRPARALRESQLSARARPRSATSTPAD